MALTRTEKDLVEMFRILKDEGKFEDKAVLPILTMLDTEEMQLQLMEYMLACDEQGQELTQDKVVKAACQIYADFKPSKADEQ